jgi:hypothetical protein
MAKQTKTTAQWEERFIHVLNRYHRTDPACMQITADKELAHYVAVMIRRYVDRSFTEALYNDRRTRVGSYRTNVVKAIDGLESAANLYRHREPEMAAIFHSKAAELIAEKQGADELLDTKRHGRFQDHGILHVAQQELKKKLGPITYETLANLINAGLRADGQDDEDKPVTAQQVRMNLDNFLARNPNWRTANSTP